MEPLFHRYFNNLRIFRVSSLQVLMMCAKVWAYAWFFKLDA